MAPEADLFSMPGGGYYIAVMVAGLVAMSSPGPATFAISQTAMARGGAHGYMLATGVATGSVIWCIAAATGLGSIMMAFPQVQQVLRYLAAAYLLFLAIKSARAALSRSRAAEPVTVAGYGRSYLSGLAIHLMNPKPVIFYAALFSAGLPGKTGTAALASIVLILSIQSIIVFNVLAFIFGWPPIARGYAKFRRLLEAGFAAFFAFASIRLLVLPFRS